MPQPWPPPGPRPSGVPTKPFYFARSAHASVLSLPAQVLFALAGLVGLAHYARAIVRAAPRRPGVVHVRAWEGDGVDGEPSEGGSGGEASEVESEVDEDKLGGRSTSVNRWIDENVPSLKGAFTPAWWLPKYVAPAHQLALGSPLRRLEEQGARRRLTPSGHLQTLWTVVGDFTKVDCVEYERTYLRVPDGGTISLDFSPPHHAALPADAPTVVVAHGLTGGSHESYVRNVLAWVVRPTDEGGLGARAVVVNFRGCAGTPLTTPQLYSAGTTVDLHTAVHYLRAAYPLSGLHGVGFSLGASVLARYLGQASTASLLSSGLVLGCPWDLPAMSRRLEEGWLRPRVYSRALGLNLLRLFRRHYDANPALFKRADSPVRHLLGVLADMDRGTLGPVRLKKVDEVMVTKLGGPHGEGAFPFDTADDYYNWASPNKVIHDVQVPLLSINAFDDPVVVGDALPLPEIHDSTHVYAAITGSGGHLGWFDGPLVSGGSAGRKRRWILRPASEYLTAAARDLAPRGSVRVVRGSPAGLRGSDGDEHKDEDAEEAGAAAGLPQGDAWEWVAHSSAHAYAGVGWRVLKEGEVVRGEEGGTIQGL
ncbi:hypothetical protein Q5752_006355 [Cryptotrichosporon argae]